MNYPAPYPTRKTSYTPLYNPPYEPTYTPPYRPPYKTTYNPPYTPPTKTPPYNPPYTPPTKTPPRVPPVRKRKQQTSSSEPGTDLYIGYVRRGTPNNKRYKWKKVTKPLPRNRAYNNALFVADNSLGRSVKVEKRGRTKQQLYDDGFVNAQKFRMRKPRSKVPGKNPIYVEQTPYLLDTPNEKNKIGIARAMKQQRSYDPFMIPKGKKKRNNWSWFWMGLFELGLMLDRVLDFPANLVYLFSAFFVIVAGYYLWQFVKYFGKNVRVLLSE